MISPWFIAILVFLTGGALLRLGLAWNSPALNHQHERLAALLGNVRFFDKRDSSWWRLTVATKVHFTNTDVITVLKGPLCKKVEFWVSFPNSSNIDDRNASKPQKWYAESHSIRYDERVSCGIILILTTLKFHQGEKRIDVYHSSDSQMLNNLVLRQKRNAHFFPCETMKD